MIEKNHFDIVWLKISQSIFPFNEDVFIYYTYIAPIRFRFFFEETEKGLEKNSKIGKMYVVGDLNSRTA